MGRKESRTVLLGNNALLEREGISTSFPEDEIDALRTEGATVVFVAQEGIRAPAITDPIANARAAIDVIG